MRAGRAVAGFAGQLRRSVTALQPARAVQPAVVAANFIHEPYLQTPVAPVAFQQLPLAQVRRQENLGAPEAVPEIPVNQVGGLANQAVPGGVPALWQIFRGANLAYTPLPIDEAGDNAPESGRETTENIQVEDIDVEASLNPSEPIKTGVGSRFTYSLRGGLGFSGGFAGLNLGGSVRSFHSVSSGNTSGNAFENTSVNTSEMEGSALNLPDKAREEVDDGLRKIEEGERLDMPLAMRKSLDAFLVTL